MSWYGMNRGINDSCSLVILIHCNGNNIKIIEIMYCIFLSNIKNYHCESFFMRVFVVIRTNKTSIN